MQASTPKDGDRSIRRVEADFFRTLGHPARVRVVELLRDGEMTVGDIQAALGIDSSGTSQHLAAMRRDGIQPALGIDRLTGFFLATTAIAALATLLYARDYLPGHRGARSLAALGGLFVLSLCLVVTARDASLFLAGWELMTLAPAAAIL